MTVEYLDILKKRNIPINSNLYKKFRSRAKTYGVSTESLIRLWETQNAQCLICSKALSIIKDDNGFTYHAKVDHCHKTGAVRGFLCSECNSHIAVVDGMITDDLLFYVNNYAKLTQKGSKLGLIGRDNFYKLVEYSLSEDRISTDLKPEDQIHNRKDPTFLSPVQSDSWFYESKDLIPTQIGSLVTWLRRNGSQANIFKSSSYVLENQTVDASSLWIVKLNTSEEKRKEFEDRFLIKTDMLL